MAWTRRTTSRRTEPGYGRGQGAVMVDTALPGRLIPYNAVLAMLDAHEHDLPTPLADAGYEVVRVAPKVSTEIGDQEVDILAATRDRASLLAIECKSSANIKTDQARRYAALKWDDAIRDAEIDLPADTTNGEIHVLFAVTSEAAEAARERLEINDVDDEFPVLSIGASEVKVLGHPTDPRIAEIEPAPVDLPWPRRLPLDEHSDSEEYVDHVAAEVVSVTRDAAGTEPGGITVPFEDLYRAAIPAYDVLADQLAKTVRTKVVAAGKMICQHAPKHFMLTTTQDDPPKQGIAILRTPENLELQGRTQGWQQVLRLLEEQAMEEEAQTSLFDPQEE